MSMADNILECDDPLIVDIARELGPLAADRYLREFNNACIQYTGFESFYQHLLVDRSQIKGWFAPRANLSTMEH